MVTAARIETAVAPLFVPASRLDRIEKAATSGADALIIDLEDAVAEADKVAARAALAAFALPALPVMLRVNGVGTPWHEEDLAMASSKEFAAIMLPKAEETAALATVRARSGLPIVALVETAQGMARLDGIAGSPGVLRIAFGSVDFSADLGCAHDWESMLLARSGIVLASRVAGKAAPFDGVTLAIGDDAAAQEDARRAMALGFSGKLCIHPRQIAPVLRGFSPSSSELAWADKVLSTSADGAVAVDGGMIDAPVRRRAEQIRRRAELTSNLGNNPVH